MKKYLFILTLLLSSGYLLMLSCKKEKPLEITQISGLELPTVPYKYFNSQNNDHVITLGRVLFYDEHLSINNSISCGSCHKQTLAFSDDTQFSSGFENRLTRRNTPPIQNTTDGKLNVKTELFWDARETSILNLVMQPILNHIEMGMYTANSLVEKIYSLPYYPELYENAFRTKIITEENINTALAAFTASISTGSSRFELSFFNPTGNLLNAEEKLGESLFNSKYNCNSCHNLISPRGYNMGFDTLNIMPQTNLKSVVNIGLTNNYADNGLGELTKNVKDNGKFKIPNLRNVDLTAPYMHDGSLATLEDVMNHYSQNVKLHENLDTRLKDDLGNPKKFNISKTDQKAMIAFLKTLTDELMISDPRFSNPFKTQ